MEKNIREFRSSRWWSNIQALRADAGMSEVELSRYIGKSDNYINTSIKNGGCPNVVDALALADAFDTTIEEIAFGVIGLEIRKSQLLAELQRLNEEIADAQADAERVGIEREKSRETEEAENEI